MGSHPGRNKPGKILAVRTVSHEIMSTVQQLPKKVISDIGTQSKHDNLAI